MEKFMMEKQAIVDKMRINDLIFCFEFVAVTGMNVEEVSKDVYSKLIDMGFIPSDLKDEHEVADMLLVDFEYEFMKEDILEFLVFHIIRLAKADSSQDLVDEEEEEEEEEDYEELDTGCVGCSNYNNCHE